MFTYKAKIKDGRLIVNVKVPHKDNINETFLNYCNQTNIRGLLKGTIQRKLGRLCVRYEGPAGISLKQRLSSPMSRFDFFCIVEQFMNVLTSIHNHSLRPDFLILNLDCVFINPTTNELMFVYYPNESGNEPINILEFIRSVMYMVQANDSMNTLAYFANFMGTLYQYDRNSIEQMINQIDPSVVNRYQKSFQESSGFITDKQRDYYQHYEQKLPEVPPVPSNSEEQKNGQWYSSDNFEGVSGMGEGTMLLNECEATALLMDEGEETALLAENEPSFVPARLIRQSTYEEVSVSKPLLEIGKGSAADYRILDNNTVSRRHAQIERRNGTYFILDLGSKNGTFVNGERINPNSEMELHDNDLIRLSNEDFIFNEGK